MTVDTTSAGESIGDRARSGSMWMLMASAATKGLGLAAQLALAWILSRREFGIYAIAVSLSVMLSVIRDGGLPTVLVHKARRFDVFAGPVFWMMLTINTVTGAVIALIAAPAARVYGEPQLTAVILLFAVSVPLCVPASILSLRLSTELRFRELGIIQLLSALIRNVLLLLFAWFGFGARSFILPLLVTNLTDAAMLWYVTRYAPWRSAPSLRLWPTLICTGQWAMLGTFAIALGNNGAYFVLGKIMPSEVVGIYFFAYQIVLQLGSLLSENTYRVLFAAFVQMGRDVARMRAAFLRSLNLIMLVGAIASMAIALIFRPLEQILWHGKWSAASGAVQVFAAIWPAAAAASVLRALQSATGRFRAWGLVTLFTAVASVLGAVLGAIFAGTATMTAVGFGFGTLIGTAINARVALAPLGIPTMQATLTAIRPWLVVGIAAGLADYVGNMTGAPVAHIALSVVCFGIVSWIGTWLFASESLSLLIQSVRQMAASWSAQQSLRGV